MRVASETALRSVVFSSVVILLFCFSSFVSQASVSPTSATSLSSGIAEISKVNSVTMSASYNWAGFALNAPVNSVTIVKGSWIEPAISCPKSTLQIASFWVGIDGFNSNTVEQTGTMALCSGGVATYSAWYEFFPNNSVNIKSLIILPRDVISATVKYSLVTQKFTTIIKDVTSGKSFSHTASVQAALRSSAEWIVEAPSACPLSDCIYPLANFGNISIGKDSTLLAGTDTATVSGVTKPIGKFDTMVNSIKMVNLAGNSVKAISSSLSNDGTSFSVAWVSAGP